VKKDLIIRNLENIFIRNFRIKRNKVSLTSLGSFYKWDSLIHIKLMMEIEKKFNISINNSARVSLISFEKLKNYLIKTLIKS
jgi:acyl carrier protein|tara:strand:+ start:2420 stop:2665 length:246 start_codon:yes stop_codon:yes gene_type:complete